MSETVYELSKNEIYGRYLKAKTQLKPLTLILSEDPYIVGPLVNSYPTCLGCHQRLPKINLCSTCKWPVCNILCEQNPNHLPECKILKQVPESYFLNGLSRVTTYASILPIRMLLLKEKDPGKFDKIMELESHIQERYNSEVYRQVYFAETVPYVQSVIPDVDEDLVLEMMGVLDTNAFQIKFDNIHIRGLYWDAAMIAHDCKPNCFFVIDPKYKLRVYASREIEPGETLTISYANPLLSTFTRRRILKTVKCFECQCTRCLDWTELGYKIGAILCPSCQSNILSPDGCNWKCGKCDTKVPNEGVNQVLINMRNKAHGLKTLGIEFFEKFLVDTKKIIHGTHEAVLEVKYALFFQYGSNGISSLPINLLQRKFELGLELLDILNHLENTWSKNRCTVALELHKTTVELARRKRSKYTSGSHELRTEILNLISQSQNLIESAYPVLKLDPTMQVKVEMTKSSWDKEMKNSFGGVMLEPLKEGATKSRKKRDRNKKN